MPPSDEAPPTTSFPTLADLSDASRDLALARYRTLRPFLEDAVPLTHVARREGIPISTARRWVARYRRDGLAGLGRKARHDREQSRLPKALREAIEGLALRTPRLSVATIHRQAATLARRLEVPTPSYSTVYELVRRPGPALKEMAHHGTKHYRDAFELVHRREAEAPNALWQADHTELDVLTLDEQGKPRKPWLTIVLDDYSRAVAGYFLSFSAPSALQTALALRQAIWRKAQPGWHVCGIPEVLYTDHGSDFTSRHIEQVAADLKIRLIFSSIGQPRGRGKIERFFATVGQVFLPRLPGYAPGSAARAAGLTLPQLATAFEDYVLRAYHVTPHSSTGQPPQERWPAGGFLPRMPESLEQLDLLLLTVAKSRQVRPDGIHFLGMRYISPTLAAFVGEPVIVRYDPRDVAEIRVFHRERFLCRAICQELAGETVTLREIVNARDRHRRALRQTVTDRRRAVESLLEVDRWNPVPEDEPPPERTPERPKLKRYFND